MDDVHLFKKTESKFYQYGENVDFVQVVQVLKIVQLSVQVFYIIVHL